MLPWRAGSLSVPARAFIVFDLPLELDPVGPVPTALVEPDRVVVTGQCLDGDDGDAAVPERRLGGVEEPSPDTLVTPLGDDIQVTDDATSPVLGQRAAFDGEPYEPHDSAVVAGDRQPVVGGVSRQRFSDCIAVRVGPDVGPVATLLRRERDPQVDDGVGVAGGGRFDRDHAHR